MKGIILAGGKGKRVYPMSQSVPKSLLPVYDKPLIYYPLTTLIENNIKKICIITNPEYLFLFEKLLGDGSGFGVSIEYRTQKKPSGIAQAFTIAKNFIKNDNVTLILGDNLFYGGTIFKKAFKNFKSGATVFGYEVSDPSRYGIVEFDSKNKVISIEEKPTTPKSNYAIPGLYIFDNKVKKVAKSLKPSKRGELEITDVIKYYFNMCELKTSKINRGCAWLDTGTSKSLNEASEYVRVIEQRQGIKIGCPEEAAFKAGFLSKKSLQEKVEKMPHVEYKEYLRKLL